jgi:hypothetical protein
MHAVAVSGGGHETMFFLCNSTVFRFLLVPAFFGKAAVATCILIARDGKYYFLWMVLLTINYDNRMGTAIRVYASRP